jgi:hypothetical protein
MSEEMSQPETELAGDAEAMALLAAKRQPA